MPAPADAHRARRRSLRLLLFAVLAGTPLRAGADLPGDRGLHRRGCYLGGPTAAASVGRSFPLLGGLLATLEGRGTAYWADVPVEGGDASVPNLALHLLFGLGYEPGE